MTKGHSKALLLDVRNKAIPIVLLVVLFFAFGMQGWSSANTAIEIKKSSELGFTSVSPRGVSGGEIIPASCESGYDHSGADYCGPLCTSVQIYQQARGCNDHLTTNTTCTTLAYCVVFGDGGVCDGYEGLDCNGNRGNNLPNNGVGTVCANTPISSATAIYKSPPGCEGGGSYTTNSTCKMPFYRLCDGTPSGTNNFSYCPNTLVQTSCPIPVAPVCSSIRYTCSSGALGATADYGAPTYAYQWQCNGTGGNTETVLCTEWKTPTVTLDPFNPSTITVGQSSTESFSSTNANSCTGSGIWNGDLGGTSATNKSTGAMNTAGTYTQSVTCSNQGASKTSETRTLVVDPLAATVPATPTGFNASPSSCGNYWLNLSWNASSGATNYKVYRSGTLVYDGSGLSYSDTGLSPGTLYSYTLTASNSAGTSGSASASGTVSTACTAAPSTPTGFDASPSSCGNYWLNLSWNASSGATNYKVYRSGTLVYDGSGLSYSDTGLSPGATYSYTLTASNSVGTSGTASDSGTVSSACVATDCQANTATWTASGNTCSGPYSTITNGNNSSVSSTNGKTGNVTLTCNNGTPVQTNPTCTATSCSNGANNPPTCNTCTAPLVWNGSNCAAPPDLTAGPVSPTVATPNIATLFSATISNIGSGSTGGSFNNFMQVATNPNGGGTITDTSAVNMPTLAASGTNTFSKSYTFTANGSYSLRVCADKTDRNDTNGGIPESNENNNCGEWTNITVSNAQNQVPTATLSATPSTIDQGQSSLLKWSSTNATSCTAVGGFSTGGATANNTGVSVSPLTTSSYQIYCDGPDGRGYSNIVTVTVIAPGSATISASPSRVSSGSSTTIIWSATGVNSCTVSGPGLSSTSKSDSQAVVVTAKSTYTITCTTGGAPVTKSVTVSTGVDFDEF